MKLKDLKVEQKRMRTNKTDNYGVYIDYQVNVEDFEDYYGKNPIWAIFFIDNDTIEKQYKVRWLDYDGWREDSFSDHATFESAANHLYSQVQLEVMLVSRGGWVKHAEDYSK